jgi:hypothetical protein
VIKTIASKPSSVAHKILGGRPSVARVVSRFSGVAMIVLGVLLLAEHLFT